MGRNNNKRAKQSESESEEEQQDIDQGDEDSNLEPFEGDDDDVHNHHQEILADIREQVEHTQHGEQLTWLAIYGLKKQEIGLNQQMDQEIEAIRNKYELLKQPYHQQLAAAVLGNKLDASLYQHDELSVVPDLKAAPEKIPDFWGAVLSTEGLLSEEQDVEILKTLSSFNCEVVDQATNHIRISMAFKGDNAYFSNKELSVEIKEDPESGAPSRILKRGINYKKAAVENSLFTLLFDEKTELQEAANVAHQIFQDYNNALYFYFRDDEEKDEGGENQPIDIDDSQEEQQEEQEEKEEKEAKAGKKKTKTNPTLEKPECKNQ